jgi:hypothetical protein
MKQLYFLDEEEKNRILNLHESATKRHYLSEQISQGQPGDPYVYKLENGKYYFKGKEGTTNKDAQKYKDWYEAKAPKAIAAIKNLFDKNINVTQTEVKSTTNTDPNKEVQDTTKQIQALLKLDQTGVMDSGLLQKINDKLNGKPQESPKSDVTTQQRPKVEPVSQLTQQGVTTPEITTMSPEQLTAGLQQQQKAAEAAKTPPTNKEKRQEIRDLKKANRAELQALKDKQRGNQ